MRFRVNNPNDPLLRPYLTYLAAGIPSIEVQKIHVHHDSNDVLRVVVTFLPDDERLTAYTRPPTPEPAPDAAWPPGVDGPTGDDLSAVNASGDETPEASSTIDGIPRTADEPNATPQPEPPAVGHSTEWLSCPGCESAGLTGWRAWTPEHQWQHLDGTAADDDYHSLALDMPIPPMDTLIDAGHPYICGHCRTRFREPWQLLEHRQTTHGATL